MWLTVLVLAVAISFEPARPMWVPLMLVRPQPMKQLAAFFLGNFASGLLAGLLVLFVFHQTAVGGNQGASVKIQIGIGIAMLLVASAMSLIKPRTRVDAGSVEFNDGGTVSGSAVANLTARAQMFLRRGKSPWLSGVIGLGTGLPSIDYLAALLVIGSSGAEPVAQVGALVMFLIVGNAVVVIPLMTYVLSPQKTLQRVGQFQSWVRSRTRRQLAAGVAVVGLIQIFIGLARL